MDATAHPLLERLVAFACVEGIIFSSAFAGIYWIKRRNILHGLTKANEWIARDEGIHTRFAVSLYHHISDVWKKAAPLDTDRVHSIIRSAVDVTEKFTREAMNTHLVGLDANDMVRYVQCTADVLASSLGYENIYNVTSPFDWMVVISLPNKTNFFESKVSEYAKEDGDGELVFDLETKF
jgi:ribonucleotide reductase beta subunit family protein with ferritin-like domain